MMEGELVVYSVFGKTKYARLSFIGADIFLIP